MKIFYSVFNPLKRIYTFDFGCICTIKPYIYTSWHQVGKDQNSILTNEKQSSIRHYMFKPIAGLNIVPVNPTNFLNFLPSLLLNSIFAPLQLTTFGFVPKLTSHSLQNQKRLILPTHPNSYQVQYLPYKIAYIK